MTPLVTIKIDCPLFLKISLLFSPLFFSFVLGCKSFQHTPAFSETQIALNKTFDITQNNPLYDYWRFTDGYSSTLRFPFYWGNVNVGVGLSDYESNEDVLPSIKTVHPSVGWSLPVVLGPFELNNGVQFGNAIMKFKDSTTSYRGERIETESSMSFMTDITLFLHKNIGIQGYYRYNYLYTYHRIKQHYIGVGFITTFENSSAIQKALK
jgi:hypothetical protein